MCPFQTDNYQDALRDCLQDSEQRKILKYHLIAEQGEIIQEESCQGMVGIDNNYGKI